VSGEGGEDPLSASMFGHLLHGLSGPTDCGVETGEFFPCQVLWVEIVVATDVNGFGSFGIFRGPCEATADEVLLDEMPSLGIGLHPSLLHDVRYAYFQDTQCDDPSDFGRDGQDTQQKEQLEEPGTFFVLGSHPSQQAIGEEERPETQENICHWRCSFKDVFEVG